jgi:uncharacterized protein
VTATPDRPWRQTGEEITIRFKVTPKSSRDRIDGLIETADGPAFKTYLRAPPAEGRANVALEKLVAGWLDVAKCSVSLATGRKSRMKTVAVAGNAAALNQRLTAYRLQMLKTKDAE